MIPRRMAAGTHASAALRLLRIRTTLAKCNRWRYCDGEGCWCSTAGYTTNEPAAKPLKPPSMLVGQRTPGWRIEAHRGPFGSSILYEVNDEDLAFALWISLRLIWTWSEAPPHRRRKVTQPMRRRTHPGWETEAAGGPELEAAFRSFRALSDSPGIITANEIAAACLSVYQWAAESGMPETATHFAEAAAHANPDDWTLAQTAGRMCRRVALYSRASQWLIQAYKLATKRGDWDGGIAALLGYGAVQKESGRDQEAEVFFRRAARLAARKGRRAKAAEAFHDLLALASERADMAEVENYARRAMELYPLHHPRLTYLAHDFAFSLLRSGYYTPAVTLLEAFLRVVPEGDLLPGLSTFAWAAAGCRMHHRFDEAERRVIEALTRSSECASASYIHLAQGAHLLGYASRAVVYAEKAILAAQERGEAGLEAESLALLSSLLQGERAGMPPRQATPSLLAIVRHFSIRLRRVRATLEPRAPRSASEVATRQHREAS